MLETSSAISMITASPSLICGVMVSLVPTSWRLMVWNGLTVPVVPVALEKLPVRNGTSWPTLISASSLSMVTIDGVPRMLVLASPRNARQQGAQLVPVSLKRPTA